MSESPLRILFLSLSFLLFGLLGGWSIIHRLAGETASTEFLSVGLIVTVSVLCAQLALMHRAESRVVFALIYRAFAAFSFAWVISVLALPLFWIFYSDWRVTFGLCISFLVALSFGLHRGFVDFHMSWRNGNRELVRHQLCEKNGEFDLDTLVRNKVHHFSLTPLFMRKYDTLIQGVFWGVMLISMVAGLNLRKLYPVPSAFAWGVPALFLSAYMLSITGIFILLAKEFFSLEKELGINIGPISGEFSRNREQELRRRLRKRKKHLHR